MCGICGWVTPHGGAPDPAVVRRMMERVAHRGPDDTGHHDADGCALGHTRLSIIDLEGGREPILDAQDQRAIVYNGEIYNHEALRQALESKAGASFKTRSDAEVPLHLLAPYLDRPDGTHRDPEQDDDPRRLLERLDGMFSFAIWDPGQGRLFAARDPYGIKPFFWTRAPDGGILFASEMKALLAHAGVPAELDPEAPREKAAFEYLLPGTTWLKGIHELPPGHFLETDGTEVRIVRYHHDATLPIPSEPDKIADHLHGLLTDAVQKRLMAERPLGVILSGGLDSSLIAAIDRDLDPDRTVHTFSVAEDESNVDFEKARLVADALGTEHKEWLFDEDDFHRDFASMIWSNEDIDYTTYFFFPLFRHVSEHATVGLCGQGADEVFGGYDRYKDLMRLRRDIQDRATAAWPEDPERHQDVLADHYQDLQSVLDWERGAQLDQFQLRLVDRNSMASGTEIRVPFLDKKIVAFGRSLPDHQLIDHDGTEKKALRLAAARTSLPTEIVDRPKRPAGRRTSPGIVERFEAKVKHAYGDDRVAARPYGQAFSQKAELLALDMFEEIFVHRRGARPKDLSWNDLI